MLRILAGGLAVILAAIAATAVIIARVPGAMVPDRNASRTWLIEHATLFDPETGTRQAGRSWSRTGGSRVSGRTGCPAPIRTFRASTRRAAP